MGHRSICMPSRSSMMFFMRQYSSRSRVRRSGCFTTMAGNSSIVSCRAIARRAWPLRTTPLAVTTMGAATRSRRVVGRFGILALPIETLRGFSLLAIERIRTVVLDGARILVLGIQRLLDRHAARLGDRTERLARLREHRHFRPQVHHAPEDHV